MLFSQVEIYIELLRTSKMFKGMSDEQIEKFLQHSDYKIEEAHTFKEIISPAEYSVVVLKGALATFDNNQNGEKKFINIFTPDKNALVAVVPGQPYSNISTEAKKPSIVLVIKTESFTVLNPNIVMEQNLVQGNIISIFYDMTANVLNRTLVTNNFKARDRVCSYLGQLSLEQGSRKIVLHLTKAEIASHLRMDTSTLMKELKALKEEKIIDINGKYIQLSDSFTINNFFL